MTIARRSQRLPTREPKHTLDRRHHRGGTRPPLRWEESTARLSGANGRSVPRSIQLTPRFCLAAARHGCREGRMNARRIGHGRLALAGLFAAVIVAAAGLPTAAY